MSTFSTAAEIDRAYHQGDYERAARLCEEAIAAAPEEKFLYWQLGLILLLQGQTVEAQTTWLMGMLDGEPEEVAAWNQEIVELLQQEAVRQENLKQDNLVWNIRQQIQEIAPKDINNLLHLVRHAIAQETYTGEILRELEIIELLQSNSSITVDFSLLAPTLWDILNYASFDPTSLEFAEASLTHAKKPPEIAALLDIFLAAAINIGHSRKRPDLAIHLCKFALQLDPDNLDAIGQLAVFYRNFEQFEQGIETAKLYASLVENLPDRVFAIKEVVCALMTTGGHWQEAYEVFQEQEKTVRSLVEQHPKNLSPIQISRLCNAYFFPPYFRDFPREDRTLLNQLVRLCHINAKSQYQEQIEKYARGHQQRLSQRKQTHRPLKIGYLSYCFKTHSVGWLARSLFEHHNREQFEIHAYMIVAPNSYDSLGEWYKTQVTKVEQSTDIFELAEAIYQDEIDILIELDSLTLDVACGVVTLKPAPIQVTWLGWDASGIPTIDYFIADPYVLPESAQEYYQEKIWRLPQTYIATDGFEVGLPTLRREQLEIESDAIVYYSAQKGYKRHIETIRLQMNILKAVPNSYFAIKGAARIEAVKSVFETVAEEEGVSKDRLRFLGVDYTEATHRANLGIADVVLDTYPYNGATTTMETLWMGIPLVTRVGEQFAARNSYTMMVNAGITEGIARTDEEYVEWGARLGKDEALRQKISWQLRKSRQSSPLWNGRQFAREMEKAYREMWIEYLKEP
ncbi:O-linked N-acetylglucosamine transferase, SPINDLY family protein [Lusitaniella coriacea LEGE 07157]|uniref:O-linked N-acetylglucosamine transferase, SPINDLY family protein n=1 Tax=Lusitaniella coriacea LEGE 07157 TaxID=945747 RepID=A0A8J7B0C5_9CYAN|nr:O-linked N-acetylglucosamine transferase, SPINDLY family protein [Lusitaniella coriacea]MBE9114795.1 O-linked N-acetylglucosamine transferase, SPINDLY family protein [Lusitaniella coriacea LEGE 07157]